MQSIANLIHDDPYLTMPREQRIAERKRRRQVFKTNPVVTPLAMAVREEPVAAPMTDPPEPKEPWFTIVDEIMPTIPIGSSPRVDDIIDIVAKYFKLKRKELVGERRTKNLILPRHIGFYLCKMLTVRSYPFIASRFGYFDHSVGVYAVDKISALIEVNETVAKHVADLTCMITGEG